MGSHRSTRRGTRLVALVVFVVVTMGAATVFAASVSRSRSQGASKRRPHVLVRYRPQVSEKSETAALAAVGITQSTELLPQIDGFEVPADRDPAAIAAALDKNPAIEDATVDFRVKPTATPSDPYLGSQWHINQVNTAAAWDQSKGDGVTIAILDTGVDGNHPDLASKMVPGYNFYDNNTDTADVHGHGTATAGTAAAATDNGAGVAAPGWNSKIMPLRIAGSDGYASVYAMIDALKYAADHGARVANISYDIGADPTWINSALQYFMSKGGVVTISAGNDGQLLSNGDNPNAIVVSATNASDALPSWSNRGNFVDVAAPGEAILTTSRGGAFAKWNGTSFSAPLVAGAAALVIGANPNLTATQIMDILMANADDLGPAGRDSSYGTGRLNIGRAVAAASNTRPRDTTAPAVSISAPNPDATVRDTVTVRATATDANGVTSMRLLIDGNVGAQSSNGTLEFAWNTSSVANGAHTLTVEALDPSGNVGHLGRTVTVANQSTTTTVPTTTTTPPTTQPGNDDVTPPVVTITSPATGAKVRGSVTITATAADPSGINEFRFYVNGKYIGDADGTSPASIAWDASAAKGTNVLAAYAADREGNWGAATVSVIIDSGATPTDTTPPVLAFKWPVNWATITNGMVVDVDARDDGSGIQQVAVTIDNQAIGTRTAAPFTFPSWDSTKASNGHHVVVVTATDKAGNAARIETNIWVANSATNTTTSPTTTPPPTTSPTTAAPTTTAPPTTSPTTAPPTTAPPTTSPQPGGPGAPTISITNPRPGASLSQWLNLAVRVEATDDVGVSRVELYVDGQLTGASTSAPWSLRLEVWRLSSGLHTLQVKAYDDDGHVGVSNVQTFTK